MLTKGQDPVGEGSDVWGGVRQWSGVLHVRCASCAASRVCFVCCVSGSGQVCCVRRCEGEL